MGQTGWGRMGNGVCHKATVRRSIWVLTLGFAGTALLAQSAPDWHKVGGSAVELMLASPATGPVERVWFSASGTSLYARTQAGQSFQSLDFETWLPVEAPPEAGAAVAVTPARLPEAGARVLTTALDRSRIYALGRQLFRSDDGGASWVNLTAYRSAIVIGSGQRSVAISPVDRDHLVVANDYGVWRTLDGGMS